MLKGENLYAYHAIGMNVYRSEMHNCGINVILSNTTTFKNIS